MLIKGGVLRIRDQERRLPAKVTRSKNRLFLLDLKVEQPVCLACTEEPWLWHGRFRHLKFNALGKLVAMVRGMPKIQHAGELLRQLPGREAEEAAIPQGGKVPRR